jgi:acyl-homoserine-lactone acylase
MDFPAAGFTSCGMGVRGMSRRWGWAIVLLVALILLGLMVWEPIGTYRAVPPPPRAYDVRIVRDDFGVPHIFGATDPDVAYGLAYAHAEDDFATIEQVLAMTRSRLGALTGEKGVPTDFVAHLLAVRETVDRRYDEQPADVRTLLDGYAAGLNRYVEEHPEEPRLARLFPVDGKDVAAGFVLRSPFFFGLDNVIGDLVGNEELRPESGGPLPNAPNGTPAGPREIEKGSNAFAIAPSRSADGATRLVSNTHQPWTGGVAWYEAVVHSGTGWNFAGALFPGSPFPLLGHNRTLGWTNTVNRPDLIDVYQLVLDDSGDRYRFGDRWLPLEEERVWLRVRFGPFVLPVPRTIARSVHGPVIRNEKGAFAIRYAGIGELKMVEQYYRLNRARDFAEWSQAMAIQGVPATNFLYADAAGNIAFYYNGLFPARRPGFAWHSILPGDRPEALWRTSLPFNRVPRLANPASGYLINANNTPFQAAGPGDELDPAAFSPLLGIERDFTNRGIRSVELLEAAGTIDEAELERIKFDTGFSRDSYAAPWLRAIAALDLRNDPQLAEAQRLLGTWDWNLDGQGRADALACLIMRPANRAHHRRQKMADPREELALAADHLREHFGRLDPPLGELLRLRRGKVDLPMDGGPDVLRAAPLWDIADDGRLAVRHGDSFIMFVSWDRAGRVRSRSIVPFGAATTRPDSPYYADQAPLFVRHRFKPVRFDPADLKGHISRAYRP